MNGVGRERQTHNRIRRADRDRQMDDKDRAGTVSEKRRETGQGERAGEGGGGEGWAYS